MVKTVEIRKGLPEERPGGYKVRSRTVPRIVLGPDDRVSWTSRVRRGESPEMSSWWKNSHGSPITTTGRMKPVRVPTGEQKVTFCFLFFVINLVELPDKGPVGEISKWEGKLVDGWSIGVGDETKNGEWGWIVKGITKIDNRLREDLTFEVPPYLRIRQNKQWQRGRGWCRTPCFIHKVIKRSYLLIHLIESARETLWVSKTKHIGPEETLENKKQDTFRDRTECLVCVCDGGIRPLDSWGWQCIYVDF